MREKFNHLYLDSHERKLLIHRVKKSAHTARQIYGLY